MAANTGELESLVKSYIKASKPASLSFRKKMKTTPAHQRYELMKIGSGYDTAALVGAWIHDLDGLTCMMNGLSPDQKYEILLSRNMYNSIVLECAVANRGTYDTEYTAKEVAKYLVGDLSNEQIFELLKTYNDFKNTPLHSAVAEKNMQAVVYLLKRCTKEQQSMLLKMKNGKGQSLQSLSVSATIGTTVEQIQEITQLQRDSLEQQRKILVEEKVKSDLKMMLAEQAAQHTQAMKKMETRLEEMEKRQKKLDVYLRTATATDESGNQEHE